MKQRVVIFEAEGGADKWFDGHRKDTIPIMNAVKEKGWDCEVIFFRDEWAESIFNYSKNRFDGYISRINPGNLPNGEDTYFNILRRLSDAGLVGMPHPDVMINFGSKDALFKLAGTDLVPSDTYAYYDIPTFREKFPVTLSLGERVLKQNRGSTGNGIWRVKLASDEPIKKGEALPLDTKIKCTEAVDNHV